MKLHVIMLDRHRTRIAVIHENASVPYGRRHVEILPTPEQEAELESLNVGSEGGHAVYEEIGETWLEP